MSKRLVAIIAPDGLPDPLRRFLVEFHAVAHPATFDPAIAFRFGAAIVSSPRFVARTPPGLPLGVWVDDHDELDAVGTYDTVRVVLTSSPAIARAAERRGVLVPAEPQPFPDVRPIAPAVRARVRRARGLQPRAIAVLDEEAGVRTWCGARLEEGLVDSALACAAVVVVRGETVIRAMAWGASIVTDSATNAALGTASGQDVLVSDGEGSVAAEALLDDEPRAAALGWSARTFYERRFDMHRTVLDTARALDLLPTGLDRLESLLDELGTPANAPSRIRTYDRLRTLCR